jgi:4-diphosphocytidyl-2-C-methyl-D-erythritol kinase
MRKITLKAKAKINLTLDVLGTKDGYHMINSLVTTIAVADTITITKRKDDKITLKTTGIPVGCSIVDNNAYKAGKLFQKRIGAGGVDIVIDKKIPVGGGLGGSSADIAGVLNGMKALFSPEADILPLANELGSDSGYMTIGGPAVITGRGEIIEPLDAEIHMPLLIICNDKGISARECYSAYDDMNILDTATTDDAVKSLKNGDGEGFLKLLKNDLYKPALKFVPEMATAIDTLKRVGAVTALMTGSGSAVFGVFDSQRKISSAYKKLLPIYGDKLIRTHTVNR